MPKKIYVPNDNELYQMQEMGANLYNYLLAKAIEILTLEGVIYSNKGILQYAYKYLKDNEEIVHAICKMYPEEIQYSEIEKTDNQLCLDLITREEDRTIYNLDKLHYFDIIALSNEKVIEKTINLLAENLHKNPKYRFEYKSNDLLDSIFNTEFTARYLYDKQILEQLCKIEPAYVIKNADPSYGDNPKEMLISAVNMYTSRYDIVPYKGEGLRYIGKDILTNPDEKVKKLIKYVEKKKNNIY